MFIRKSKHEEILKHITKDRDEWEATARYYFTLQIQLKNKIEELTDAIDQISGQPQVRQFSAEEINQLIRLCHPDKHNNSKSSTEITQKLLQMRKDS